MTERLRKIPPAWHPPQWDTKDAAAIQALIRGDARPDQQQRAIKYIVESLSGAYDISYRPDSDRDTAFAEGRRFVGMRIITLSKINLNHKAFEEKQA